MDKKYKKKCPTYDMGDGDNLSFTPKKIKQEQGELEVTGVSRSGRVRKKSSKLVDFESSEEPERHSRGRKADKDQFGSPPHSIQSPKAKKHALMKSGAMSDEDDPANMYPIKDEAPYSDESGPDIGLFQAGDSSLDSLGSDVDDEDLDDAGLDDVGGGVSPGFQKVVQDPDSMPSSGTSLYMLEKSAKKNLIIRDGKIVGRTKTQRKDKGKTRFTAYMLWAKEIRKEIMAANPEMDFSTTSKKLGELWSTVPYNEKFLWKRRAKRAATKAQRSGSGTKRGDTAGVNKYINKQNVPQHALSIAETVLQLGQPTVMAAGGLAVSPPEHAVSTRGLKGGLVSEPVVGTGLYKVIGTAPIDLAAHLRLLGESLTIIGERLKEHKGQIAVSGSLSVLLDSLVCAIGPLTCLTQQVPELNVISQEKLSKILDNIAYIMPGL